MKRAALPEDVVRAAVAGLDGWDLSPDGISIAKAFTFSSFSEAFAFMTQAALLAERIDHHPDWSNSYRRVSVRLSTHSAGGLTELDIRYAEGLERIAAGRAA